jgi:hypothetical protein
VKPRFYTGEEGRGNGSILFIPGNPYSPFVAPAPREKVLPDFSKKIPEKWSSGPIDNWGDYRSEMSTRDEGARGLPLDHRHPLAGKHGIEDHKEYTARKLMERLHQGDAAYFEGLAKTLRKFKTLNGNPWPELKDQDQEVVDAIRIAAQEADEPPYQHAVLEKLAWAGDYKLDKLLTNYLTPLGFGWLPSRKEGRPKKLP